VASAFTIVAHFELQPNLGEETIALLRVMIHTPDDATFGCQVPTVTQWAAPHRIVQVQAVLLSGLPAPPLHAFLVMFGKQ
jgi:hypothetical protein